MKMQWLLWILIIALGASLPWTVRDLTGNGPDLAVERAEADAAAPRTLAARGVDYVREQWISLGASRDLHEPDQLDTERFDEVAERVGRPLEAELARKGFQLGDPLFIRIFKESSELEVWLQNSGGEFSLFKVYPICRWSGKLGPKLKEGDRQSPEGFYFVSPGRMNPNSDFHLSFDLGFPNEYDQHHERTGSYLMVHGDCVSIGCYAMTDNGIEEIYTLADAALENGQKLFRVHAFPFRMTDERMDQLDEDGKWFEFWANLKEGYDFFEMLQQPPNVTVEDGKYGFEIGG